MRRSGQMTDLRRKAVVTAALCAVLGGVVPLAMHAHRWLGLSLIGVQVLLLVTALTFFAQSSKTAGNK